MTMNERIHGDIAWSEQLRPEVRLPQIAGSEIA
jgi:hypothetical protein